MPGYKLQETTTSRAQRFSVVGTYAQPNRDRFVRHVALLRDDCELYFGSLATVRHTLPPIVAGEHSSQVLPQAYGQCAVHVVAYLEDLTADEAAGIETTLADIDVQTQLIGPAPALSHYVVDPPVLWVIDNVTGTKRFRKFSCVGFVLECYQEGAGICLLNLDGQFPPVDIETLAAVYGNPVRNEKLRQRFGLTGPGEEWRIVVPGYVMHSLARTSSEVRQLPYAARSADEANFPADTAENVAPGSGAS